MNERILAQVRGVVADLFALPLDAVTEESSPDTIEAWDSVQHLNLVLALEQKFFIQFEPEDIEQMLSVGLTAMLVEEVASRT